MRSGRSERDSETQRVNFPKGHHGADRISADGGEPFNAVSAVAWKLDSRDPGNQSFRDSVSVPPLEYVLTASRMAKGLNDDGTASRGVM